MNQNYEKEVIELFSDNITTDSIDKIKNFVSNGVSFKTHLNVSEKTVNGLFNTLNLLLELKVKKVKIDPKPIVNSKEFINSFLHNFFYCLDRLEEKIEIETNVPKCVLVNATEHYKLNSSSTNIKHILCISCKYFNSCNGISSYIVDNLKLSEFFAPIKDIPIEVIIEVTPKCNLKCIFCFNNNSFAKQGRNFEPMSSDFIKKIIDEVCQKGVKYIRFTGGEPLLRKDIFNLIKYAKEKGLIVRLNTNGTLINPETISKIENLVDCVLVPINASDPEESFKTTLLKETFEKRLTALKLLKNSKIKVVRAGTVASLENIKNLEKIFHLVKFLNVDEWEVYRPVPSNPNDNSFDSKQIAILVEKLLKFQKEGMFVPISNAIPFCSYDSEKMKKVAIGSMYDDGHVRIIVDPKGYSKPSYCIDKNVGNPTNLFKSWDNSFMKKMRNLEFVPIECKGCKYLEKCKGGNRFISNLVNGSFSARDPLMNKENLK